MSESRLVLPLLVVLAVLSILGLHFLVYQPALQGGEERIGELEQDVEELRRMVDEAAPSTMEWCTGVAGVYHEFYFTVVELPGLAPGFRLRLRDVRFTFLRTHVETTYPPGGPLETLFHHFEVARGDGPVQNISVADPYDYLAVCPKGDGMTRLAFDNSAGVLLQRSQTPGWVRFVFLVRVGLPV